METRIWSKSWYLGQCPEAHLDRETQRGKHGHNTHSLVLAQTESFVNFSRYPKTRIRVLSSCLQHNESRSQRNVFSFIVSFLIDAPCNVLHKEKFCHLSMTEFVQIVLDYLNGHVYCRHVMNVLVRPRFLDVDFDTIYRIWALRHRDESSQKHTFRQRSRALLCRIVIVLKKQWERFSEQMAHIWSHDVQNQLKTSFLNLIHEYYISFALQILYHILKPKDFKVILSGNSSKGLQMRCLQIKFKIYQINAEKKALPSSHQSLYDQKVGFPFDFFYDLSQIIINLHPSKLTPIYQKVTLNEVTFSET
jgi:hypothetical protein